LELKDRIKSARDSLNLKQDEFAELLKISPNYVSMLETGKKTNPNKFIIELIEKIEQGHYNVARDSQEDLGPQNGAEIARDYGDYDTGADTTGEGHKHVIDTLEKKRMHQLLNEIMEKGDMATVAAIRANLEQFRVLVTLDSRVRALEREKKPSKLPGPSPIKKPVKNP